MRRGQQLWQNFATTDVTLSSLIVLSIFKNFFKFDFNVYSNCAFEWNEPSFCYPYVVYIRYLLYKFKVVSFILLCFKVALHGCRLSYGNGGDCLRRKTPHRAPTQLQCFLWFTVIVKLFLCRKLHLFFRKIKKKLLPPELHFLTPIIMHQVVCRLRLRPRPHGKLAHPRLPGCI